MRDALGGTVSLVIVSVFIVIALGYMAFNVNYTKAFRMKDKIISLYEDYQGNCHNDVSCRKAILDYANTLGYANDNNLKCDKVGSGYSMDQYGLYCYKQERVHPGKVDPEADVPLYQGVAQDQKERYYYRIVTKINLQIPVIQNVFDFSAFYIKGDTKAFIVE